MYNSLKSIKERASRIEELCVDSLQKSWFNNIVFLLKDLWPWPYICELLHNVISLLNVILFLPLKRLFWMLRCYWNKMSDSLVHRRYLVPHLFLRAVNDLSITRNSHHRLSHALLQVIVIRLSSTLRASMPVSKGWVRSFEFLSFLLFLLLRFDTPLLVLLPVLDLLFSLTLCYHRVQQYLQLALAPLCLLHIFPLWFNWWFFLSWFLCPSIV